MGNLTKTYDVAVIGAGIVGAACAAALSREGLRVVVIDKNGIAGGTTAAGMGHIVVMDDSDAQFALTKYSQDLWKQLEDELPATCEYEHCGTIWVAADGEEMDEVRRKNEFYASRGIETEILDGQALREAEPNLAEGLAGGLLVKSDTVVYQLTATRHLIERSGVELRFGDRVTQISDAGVRLQGGELITAGNIINAAGAEAGGLTPQLNIRKRKGHLVITERYDGFVSHQLVELGYLKSAHGHGTESVAFNVQPRSTGQILLGSSRQFGVESSDVDRAIVNRMTTRAFEYMPTLRDFHAVRVWTGFRPATPDNLPYIGKISGFENVYAAAGHEGLGITTALGTAELLADEIMGRTPKISPEPYQPSRDLQAN
jgi:glycine/D-amino acid oxidase-like deaminating enzyme